MLEYGRVIGLSAMLVLAAVMSFDTIVALGNDIQVRTEGKVRYLSGGIGVDGREALTKLALNEKMNVKLVFAERNGAFLSAVPVTITDASGAVHLQVKTEGPWLFLQLPAGDYRFRAERSGHVQAGSITVAETGRTELVVSFP